MTRRKATIGSISTGTLLSLDLVDSFAWELQHLAGNEPTDSERALLTRANEYEPEPEDESADDSELVNDLQDALNDLAPPYCYFGTLEGDGADFGFWPSRESIEESDALRVSDTSEVPEDYSGEVLHTNDHGNLTLYVAESGKLTEVWGIV